MFDDFHAGNMESDYAALDDVNPDARYYVRLTRDGDSWDVIYPSYEDADAAVKKFNTGDYEDDSPIRATLLGMW